MPTVIVMSDVLIAARAVGRAAAALKKWSLRLSMGLFVRTMLVAAFCSIGQMAAATPPDMISVRDELFGIAPGSIVLMRTTDDNLGLYDAEHHDSVLVVVDRETGQETLWPVYRVRRTADLNRDATGILQTAVGEVLPGAVNPYEKLRILHGIPKPALYKTTSDQGEVVVQGGMLTIRYDDGVVIEAQISGILGQLEASLDRLAETVGDYPRFAPISTTDLLKGRLYAPQVCDFTEPFSYDDKSGHETIRLLRATCTDEGEVTSILVQLRP